MKLGQRASCEVRTLEGTHPIFITSCTTLVEAAPCSEKGTTAHPRGGGRERPAPSLLLPTSPMPPDCPAETWLLCQAAWRYTPGPYISWSKFSRKRLPPALPGSTLATRLGRTFKQGYQGGGWQGHRSSDRCLRHASWHMKLPVVGTHFELFK